MPRWAKLSERVGQDGVLCELAEENMLAALLFTWSLPAADVYGILPGDARQYHARVAPALSVSREAVQAAIDAQAQAGLVMSYEADGNRLIYIRNFHRHQDVKWKRVGSPEHPLPPDWRIPGKLRDLLGESGTNPGPEEFGLCRTATGLCVQVPDQSASCPDQSRLDTDTDTDKSRLERLSSQTPSAPATGERKAKKRKKTPRPTEDWNAETLALREGKSKPVLAALDSWMERLGEPNKSRKITDSRCFHQTQMLIEILGDVADEEVWCVAVEGTLGARKPNRNYLLEVIASEQEKRQRRQDNLFDGPGGRAPQRVPTDGVVGPGNYGETRSGSFDDVFGPPEGEE